jgi:hypothetical protein
LNAICRFVTERLKELEVQVPRELHRAVIEELAHAIEPPIHEQALQPYGSLITNSNNRFEERIKERYQGKEHSLHTDAAMRHLSDGVRTFFCRYISKNTETHSLWRSSTLSFGSEVALFSLRDEAVFGIPRLSPHRNKNPPNDVVIVQRSINGDVTLLATSSIVKITEGAWTVRPYQYQLMLEEYCRKIEEVTPSQLTQLENVYRSIARTALHILGARRIGATILVQHPDDKLNEAEDYLEGENALRLSQAKIVITDKADQPVVAHLLSHNDGAAVFAHDGTLVSVGNWLKAKIDLDDFRRNPGGTRQLSAKSASRHSRLPVVTVSSDGPVRAYFQGEQVLGPMGARHASAV